MIKVNKDNVEIKGHITEILTEMTEAILVIKEKTKDSEVFSQLVDVVLLKSIGADNKLEFLTDKKICLEKAKNKIAKLGKMEGDK